jgi:hypothetical protein
MKHKLITIISTTVAFIFIAFVLNSCCKRKYCSDPSNPQCINYDPCYGKKPNAGFKIRQSCWSDFSNEWNTKAIEYNGFSDTNLDSKLDLLADFNSIPGTKYSWKFDGMSTLITTKDIKGIDFYSYTSNLNNKLPFWDSFYCKPLGVTLTVTTPPNECVGNDTIYTQKRYITFAQKCMYFGKFRGYFSTKPTQEVDIVMNNLSTVLTNYLELYINFPYHENDTIKLDNYKFIGSTPSGYSETYQKYDWSIDITKPYDLNRLKGILGVSFRGKYNASIARNEVEFTYQYQKTINDPIENITFKGYQLEAYRRNFKL